MEQASVLITTEGTYPCYSGGVSVWCDYLIREVDDVAFHVFALNHAPSQETHFQCPPNVKSLTLHAMWGTEEPGTDEYDFIKAHERKLQTREADMSARFLPHFRTALHSLLSVTPDPQQLGQALAALHRYFRKFDYADSMRSRIAWDAFVHAVGTSDLKLDLHEATQCMRWLQRYLSLLAVQYPRVDVVHSSMAGLAGIPGVLCKATQGSSFVLTEHGIHLRELYLFLSGCGYSPRTRQFLIRFHTAITRMNYHYADVVTTLGQFNRKWQLQFGADSRKIRLIPNGVDTRKFHPRPSLTRKRPTVLTMARIFRLKGIDVLIRAAALVRDRVPDVLFRVMGDVADRSYFAECENLTQQHGLEQNISFGATREPEVEYSQCDLLCVPSLSEGMPFVVIEAMLCGCPVVATDVGNVADLLQDTGLVVTPNQPNELADAVLRMLDGPDAKELRATFTKAALKRAGQHFTISEFSRAFRNIYEEMRYACVSTGLSRAAS
jgi:polysaccharide biosynthesis protein PelF